MADTYKSPICQPDIHLIYYTFLQEPKWKPIIQGQCEDILASGIPAQVHIIVCSVNEDLIKEGIQCIKEWMAGYSSEIIITSTSENQYEYPGLKYMHDLSKTLPENDLMLYMHSKGMVFHPFIPGRFNQEETLTCELLYLWENYLSIFETQPLVQKAGLFPGHKTGPDKEDDGFLYYNFFWIRSSYVKTLPAPTIPRQGVIEDRFPYEVWIGKGNCDDCYSTHDKRVGRSNPHVLPSLNKDSYKNKSS